MKIDLLGSVVINLSGVRREHLQGRDYIVAPVSLIVPGVLPGSRGPLLYPTDEVVRNIGAWHGTPLTAGHPYVNGRPVSASQPGVKHIGTVRDPRFTNGRLTAEGWFDVERTRLADNRLLQSLERGERIEVSTGLFTDNEPAPVGATHRGRSYDFIARNYRPDHLAVLIDQQGACSLRDGCGVNNAARPDDFARIASYFKVPIMGQTNDNDPLDGYDPNFIANGGSSLSAVDRDDVMPTANIDYGELSPLGKMRRAGEAEEVDSRDENRKRLGLEPSFGPNDPMPTTSIDWATGEIAFGK